MTPGTVGKWLYINALSGTFWRRRLLGASMGFIKYTVITTERTGEGRATLIRERSLDTVVDYHYRRKLTTEEKGAMPKRNRTRQRTDEFLALSLQAHQGGWSEERVAAEIEILLMKNPDLVDEAATNTARSEARLMAHPRLRPWIQNISDLAERIMAKEPAGTKKRYNHELRSICRHALEHPRGVGAALLGLESRLPN